MSTYFVLWLRLGSGLDFSVVIAGNAIDRHSQFTRVCTGFLYNGAPSSNRAALCT